MLIFLLNGKEKNKEKYVSQRKKKSPKRKEDEKNANRACLSVCRVIKRDARGGHRPLSSRCLWRRGAPRSSATRRPGTVISDGLITQMSVCPFTKILLAILFETRRRRRGVSIGKFLSQFLIIHPLDTRLTPLKNYSVQTFQLGLKHIECQY